jgi:hypothetical protein
MKTGRTVTGCGIITALALFAVGCDNPFRSDNGQSTPAEDSAAIATYTQTVNQASQDTTIRPVTEINGDNNTVNNYIILGDRNDPTPNPAPEPAEEPAEPEEPSAP